MRVLLAGGGTAGHINPAVAIAKTILAKEKDADILFVGTKKGMEHTLIPKEGFAIEYIKVEGMKGHKTMKNLVPALEFVFAIGASKRIIRHFSPDVVIGTGGYVCAPVVFAASRMKIPTLIHEQNVFPGSAIKLLARRADVTAISFAASTRYLKEAKEILLTGNPIRPGLLKADRAAARRELGVGDRTMILSFGGSLGAERINDVMTDYLALAGRDPTKYFYFATGTYWYDRVTAALKERGLDTLPNLKVVPYIHNMDTVLAAADLVIGRSGAITISELCALGKPSILIPSLNVTHNHQEYNARALVEKGAAAMILDPEFDAQRLKLEIDRMTSGDTLLQTGQNAYAMRKVRACEMIYEKMKKLTAKH